MPFGYIPHSSPLKDFLLRLLGWPNVVRRLQAPALFEFLNLKHTDVVADLGCGGGEFSFEMAGRCRKCFAVDISISQKAQTSFRHAPNLHLASGSVLDLPFADNCFDKILLSSVLQMVGDDEKLLSECRRTLKSNGRLILSVPTDYVWVKSLNRLKGELKTLFKSQGKGYYTLAEIEKILNTAGFCILNTTYAPKNLGSLLCELWLYGCYRTGLPLYSQYYFVPLYPLAAFDPHLRFRSVKGNELIIHATKEVEHA